MLLLTGCQWLHKVGQWVLLPLLYLLCTATGALHIWCGKPFLLHQENKTQSVSALQVYVGGKHVGGCDGECRWGLHWTLAVLGINRPCQAA